MNISFRRGGVDVGRDGDAAPRLLRRVGGEQGSRDSTPRPPLLLRTHVIFFLRLGKSASVVVVVGALLARAWGGQGAGDGATGPLA